MTALRDRQVLSLTDLCRNHALAVWRNTNRFFELKDLEQDAYVGALYAVDHWDKSRGGLHAYASRRIRGEVVDGIRRRSYLSRSYHKELKSKGNLPPHAMPAVSIDTYDGWTPGYTECGYREVEDRDRIVRAIRHLRCRQRYVVEQYYYANRSLLSLAHELHVTEGRVSQILNRARQKMHDEIDEL